MKKLSLGSMYVWGSTALLVALLFGARAMAADAEGQPPVKATSQFWDTSNWDLGDDAVLPDNNGFGDPIGVDTTGVGSPVNPKKVVICHNGHTITVSQAAVAAHLAHGDTLGPCPAGTTMFVIVCHRGVALVVRLVDVPARLRQGDTLGACSGEEVVIMCNGNENVVVARASAQSYLDKGYHLGPCQGEAAEIMCHKDEPIVVAQNRVDEHLKRGDTLGPCRKK